MGGGRRAGPVRPQQGRATSADSPDGPVRRPRGLSAGDVHRAGQQGGEHDIEADGGDTEGEVRSVKDNSLHRRRPVYIREQKERRREREVVHYRPVGQEDGRDASGLGLVG